MLFARNLKHSRECLRVVLEQRADLLCNVLVDEQDRNVGALCHVLEGGLDGACLRLCET